MKRAKIIIVVLVVILVLIAGVFITNKMNNQIQESSETKYEVAKVESGDIEVKISASGVFISENKTNQENLKLQVEVDELDINSIKINQGVDISVDAYPDKEFEGEISYISNAGKSINGVTTFSVMIDVDDIISKNGVIKEDTSLRMGQSSKYTSIKTLGEGEEVKIIESGDWYKIRIKDNVIGYVDGDDIEEKNISEVKTTTKSDEVSLRKDISSPEVQRYLTTQDEIAIIDEEDEYYKVKLEDNTTGFVLKDDIEVQPIKIGMNASMDMISQKKEDTLYIPIEGLNKRDDKTYYVIDAITKEEKDVEVGIKNENYVEITKGLSSGDEIQLSTIIQHQMSIPMNFGR